MSVAEALGRRRGRQAGFTILEVSMVMALLSLVALVIERTLDAAVMAQEQVEATCRATERSEKIAYEIVGDVDRSRRLFGADDVGASYLAALDLGRDPLAAGSRLPRFEEVRPLGPDPLGEPYTGNILLFAREAAPAQTVVNPASKAVRTIDLYRFVCVYRHQTDRRVIPGSSAEPGEDLVVWRSRAYPNWAQIMAIADGTERARAVGELVTRFSCDAAWDPNASAGEAFYEMDATGTIASSPLAAPVIEEDEAMSDRGRLVYAHCQLSATLPADPVRRAMLSTDDLALWSPHGFEVKFVGGSGARTVWLHVVVETAGGHRTVGVHASTLMVSTKDL